MERIVVPFTSAAAAAAVSTLSGRLGAEIVGVAVDLGQGVPLEELRDAALAAGARRCHALDRRERLAGHFLWPTLRARAIGVAGEPVVTAPSAACVAEAVVEVAGIEGATATAVAAPTSRERQRLLAALRHLAPRLGVIAAGGSGDADEERNVWARVRMLAAADAEPRVTPASAASPASLVVTIERGLPVALNRVAMPPVELVDSLATIARTQGVAAGHVAVGEGAAPSRWLVQAPAAHALHLACVAVADSVLDEPTQAFLDDTAATYARLLRDGRWFTRLRGGLDALAAHVLEDVSGEVTMTMQQGRIEVAA